MEIEGDKLESTIANDTNYHAVSAYSRQIAADEMWILKVLQVVT